MGLGGRSPPAKTAKRCAINFAELLCAVWCGATRRGLCGAVLCGARFLHTLCLVRFATASRSQEGVLHINIRKPSIFKLVSEPRLLETMFLKRFYASGKAETLYFIVFVGSRFSETLCFIRCYAVPRGPGEPDTTQL